MSVMWDPAADTIGEGIEARTTLATMATVVVFAATLFNLVLCFVNTTVFGIGANVVIGTEIALIGMALGFIWYRGYALYTILLVLTAYFFAVMLIRSEFDPKIARDLLIPIVFFFLGSYLGSFRSAGRLVTVLIFVALGVALFEWLALDTYLHYFDVIHYYAARGTEQSLDADTAGGLFIKGTDSNAGLYINGTRFEERTLLPFLGEHRVSGIFMEPVSAGNFGAIAFAWVLLRDRHRVWTFIAKTLAIATILVLADARFGFYLCIATVIIYPIAPVIRSTMLYVAPFLVVIALAAYGGLGWQGSWDNTIAGRFLWAGHSLAALDVLQLLGLQTSDFFTSGYAGDSGYGYALVKVGFVGLAAIWALFIFSPPLDADAWRFKNFIAFYIVFLLTISASLFSIKTSALMWFLYGTLSNPDCIAWANPLPAHADVNSESASS
ncbi:MAG: surface polysaccharide polymerase [Xanthobacteraceae bacterium]